MRIERSLRFKLTNLKENGMLQYFWHSPSSRLPIRDVLGENKVHGKSVGRKPEPHIEIGAENFIAGCYQTNIKKFCSSDRRYLFLVTTCRSKRLEEHLNEQYIVGYIVKEEAFDINGHVCVKGFTKIVPFLHDLRMTRFFGRKFSQIDFVHNPTVGENKSNRIRRVGDSHRNQLNSCVKEIARLDEGQHTCEYEKCIFKEDCLRLKLD
jgi:hypothetical protein